MRMVIGGAYQGKMEYAAGKYPEIQWIDGAECGMEDVYSCEGIFHFEEYIRRMLKKCDKAGGKKEDLPVLDMESIEEVSQNLVRKLIEKNPEIVIVSREIGYGLVPIDEFERKYREAVGRICTGLAAYSKKVDRVVCGIAAAIKDE